MTRPARGEIFRVVLPPVLLIVAVLGAILGGVATPTEAASVGAVGALKKAVKLDQVTVIAFDGMPAGKQAIKAGDIYADPVQHPDKIGRECIKAMIAYLSGDKPEANIDIPATLYTKEEADKDPSLK